MQGQDSFTLSALKGEHTEWYDEGYYTCLKTGQVLTVQSPHAVHLKVNSKICGFFKPLSNLNVLCNNYPPHMHYESSIYASLLSQK